MPTLILLDRRHDLRGSCERFVGQIYEERYGARRPSLPARMIALRDEAGRWLCAAGLRHAPEEFFSEAYLAAPIERVLAIAAGRPVARAEIIEISTLASRSPRDIGPFLRAVTAQAEAEGFSWAFFTVTQRLSHLVGRLRPGPIRLCAADRSRIATPERWGSYYAAEPAVYAMTRRRPSL